MDDAQIGAKLLWKMKRLGAWGTRHVSESNLQKGFPPAARGKRLLEIAESLRKGASFSSAHPITNTNGAWFGRVGMKLTIE
ncbi:MAG: hypothetical protein AABX01_04845 [Candidatus Micrarchaeota archaeon]